MKTMFSFDSRSGLLKVSLDGSFNTESLFSILAITRKLNAQLQPQRVIYDCTAITAIDVPAESVGSLAGVRPVFSPEITEIILAPQEYLFGIARMYQQMAADIRPNIKVVKNSSEAYQALGLSEPPRYAELTVA